MKNCSECGTELTGDPSFCPDCGSKLQSSVANPNENHEQERKTAPCQKCESQISTKADRCPQCGYEPSSEGILGTIFNLISFLWVGISAILYIIAFAALFLGNSSAGGFLVNILLITAFSAAPFTYLYLSIKTKDRGPTESLEIFGRKIS
jgi:RNA polymerase subunit RPABC4/transcription elongation factor Spt4